MNIKYLALVSLLTISSLTSQVYALTEAQEKKLSDLIHNFLDVNVEPNKSFEKWALELINLLKEDPKFAQFCMKLHKLKKCKNAKRLGLEFRSYKNLMPNPVKNYLTQKNPKQLLSIFEKRIKA